MAWTSKLSLFACACILVLSAYVIYDLNGSSLDFSDSEFVLIVTDSMDGDVSGYDVDSFPADTVAVIHHVPAHEVRYIKVGDVVAYHNGSMLITHRVVSIDVANSVMTLKGDNASSSETVSFDDVDGVVVGTNHAVGAAFSFVRSNFVAIVCFIGAILAAVTAFKYYKTIPKEKIHGLRRGTAFAVAMVAVLGIAFAGVGYAYTAATENSGNNIFSEYTVLAQSEYTYSANTDFKYYSVTKNGSFSLQVGNGAVSEDLRADESCFLSLSETTVSTVVITGGSYAGTYTIDMSGVTLSDGKPSTHKVTQTVEGPLDFTKRGLLYEGKAFDNVSIGNNITVVYDALSMKYTITGTLAYQNNSGGDAMDKLGMLDTDHHGVSFVVKTKSPATRYFITHSQELFNSYCGVKMGVTDTIKVTNIGHAGEDKIAISSDEGFARLYGDWKYILKVTDNSISDVGDLTRYQYAVSSGYDPGTQKADWTYYHYVNGKWVEQASLIMTQNVVAGDNKGYDTELFLAGPDANIDSQHYASGTTEPIYRKINEQDTRLPRELVKNGTITFSYDSTVE